MRTWQLPVLLVALLLGTVSGQEPEVWIIASYEDEKLSKVVEEVTAMAKLLVEVDRDVRDRKVTVDLDDTPADALKKIAKAAKAHLWTLGGKRYRIASKSQPKDGKETKKPAKKKEEPEWKKTLKERLEVVEVDVEFSGVSIQKVLARFAKVADIPIYLDPDVLATRKAETLKVYTFMIPKRTEMGLAIDAVAASVRLQTDLRWGGVFVSTSTRLRTLPVECLPEPTAEKVPDWEAALRKTLATTKIKVALKNSTVSKAIDKLKKAGKVKIRYKLSEVKKARRVTIDVKDLPLGDALSLVLIPRKLKLGFEKKELVVKPAD